MMGLVRSPWLVTLVLLIIGASGQGSASGNADTGALCKRCGTQTFNPEESTCCKVHRGRRTEVNLTTLLSQDVSGCCGLQAYNPVNEICCNSSVLIRTPETVQLCLNGNFGHLYCGSNGTKFKLKRLTPHHQCCGQKQFNTQTECCSDLQVVPLNTYMGPCRGSESFINSASAYDNENFDEYLFCGVNGSKVMLPRKSHHHQCCGPNQFNTFNESCHQSKVEPLLCEENVADSGTKHHPDNDCKQNHCCGNRVYDASSHICCDGRRYCMFLPRQFSLCRQDFRQSQRRAGWQLQSRAHKKGENVQCCGTEAYDANNPLLKCCMGSLHNVTSEPALCCGSRLQKKEETCCMSEHKQRLYSTKIGLQCCGHLHYNTSLWSCCSGKLNRTRNQIQTHEFRLLSLNNLDKWKLCKNITLGIVESVSHNSIVINHVMKINVKRGLIYSEPQHYVQVTDCGLPELTVGKMYFFEESNVYVNMDQKSVLEALHFIFSIKDSVDCSTVKTQ